MASTTFTALPRLRSPRAGDVYVLSAAIVAIGVSAVLPWLRPHLDVFELAMAIVVVAAVAVPVLASSFSAPPKTDSPTTTGVRQRTGLFSMMLYLSPVILLTLAFPVATARIGDTQVGGVGLMSLLLASSVTVPWLGQAVCLPIYRAIGPLIPDGNMDVIQRRFCEVWPMVFVQTVPCVAVFAVPVQMLVGWSPTALLTYLGLCVLHVAFVQSLIVANVAQSRWRWASAWCCYAAALLIFPTAWYLPPVVGLISQLIPLRRYLPRIKRPIFLAGADVMADLVRGLLLGAVLWADKLLLFIATRGDFPVDAVFIALLPAVVAYNYYFVCMAPHIDRAVGDIRVAMESGSAQLTAQRSSAASNVVGRSIVRTAFIGAAVTLVVTLLTNVYSPTRLSLVAAVGIASFLFMMTTLVCYKLDYIGYRRQAQFFSAVHLVICVGLFVAFPVGATLYLWFIAFEAALFGAVLYTCLKEWRTAEYALFWRHATAW